MRQVVLEKFQKGQTVRDYVKALDGALEAGKPVRVTVDARTEPWLDHVIEGWVDGPPVTTVAAVFSGRDPDADHKWRRFTVTRVGAWHCENRHLSDAVQQRCGPAVARDSARGQPPGLTGRRPPVHRHAPRAPPGRSSQRARLG